MKKGGFLRNVLDTIRPNQQQQQQQFGPGTGSGSLDGCGGQLKAHHFALGLVARHGFPVDSSAFAYDPVQRIAAIGTSSGSLRVFGRPGVDAWAEHKPGCAVTHLRFIINQGALITVTADDGLHLWSLRGSQLKLQLSSSTSSSGGGPTPAVSPVPQAAAASQSMLAATKQQQNSADAEYKDYTTSHQLNMNDDNQNNYIIPKQLQILHSLKFKREHITCLHQTLMSKWLYVGTDRGNVHVVNVETFQLSGYSIAWNKTIELTRKTHPGPIIHLSECPQDSNKLLIGYQSGCIALWDLKGRTATCRYYQTDGLLWLSWLHDGKQFLAAHSNGSLVTWLTRSVGSQRPVQVFYPHAKGTAPTGATSGGADSAGQQASLSMPNDIYEPITKVEWRSNRNNEPLLLFAGGLPSVAPTDPSSSIEANEQLQQRNNQAARPTISRPPTSLTVMLGKSITVLELDKPIVDFTVVCEGSPHESEPSEPSAAFVLLEDELTIIDLQTYGYPTFAHPYPAKKLAHSPVTCIKYLVDCSPDLIGSLLCSAGANGGDLNNNRANRGSSGRDWPIAGGDPSNQAPSQSYSELVITGHADGSIKFWDMCGLNFDLLAQVSCADLFEGPNWPPESFDGPQEGRDGVVDLEKLDDKFQMPLEFPFSISRLEFCSSGENSAARLLVAGALGQVIQFKLPEKMTTSTTTTRKKEPQQQNNEPVVLVVEQQEPRPSGPISSGNQSHHRRHMVLKVKRTTTSLATCNVSPKKSPSSLAKSRIMPTSGPLNATHGGKPARAKPRFAGLQPELICLSPLAPRLAAAAAAADVGIPNRRLYRPPPKVTALVFEATHSILAYAHEDGLVLVDVIQKSVIISASLADLYGGGGGSLSMGSAEVSIQPFATSSILQQHYQDQQQQAAAEATSPLPLSTSSSCAPTTSGSGGGGGNNQPAGRGATTRPQPQQNEITMQDNINTANNGTASQPIDNNGPSKAAAAAKSTRAAGNSLTNNTANPCNGSQPPAALQPDSSSSSGGQSQPTSSSSAATRQPRSATSAGSAFQRQLSFTTAALKSDRHHNSSSPTTRDSSMGPGFRQFQRQMTATQLLSHESPPPPAAHNNNNNKQRALLGPTRGNQTLGLDPALASSMSSLGGAGGSGVAVGSARSARNRQPEAGEEPYAQQQQQQQRKAPTKGKRIIGRMLSISTIHSSLGSSGGSGDGPSTMGSDTGGSGSQTMSSASLVSKNASSSLEQTAPDKIDSSFIRSRSSSCSSEAPSPRAAGQQQQQSPQLSRGESIQCLCFLDWIKAFQASNSAEQQQPPSNNNNHKSLGSIDGSAQPCQLALWLGTSQGSVLLLALSMPDNDDNRILQLQSVEAEPIPQATIKLQGPIKCLATFTSGLVRGASAAVTQNSRQPPPPPPSPPLVHSASGSLEAFECLAEARGKSPAGVVAPLASRPKSAQPPLSVAPSTITSSFPDQPHQQQPAVFLAIVGERQARIYQALGPEQMIVMMSTKSPNRCLAKIDFPGTGGVKCASLMQMRPPNESCLATQMSVGGQLQVYSLPQLRVLLEAQLPDQQPAPTAQVVFGNNGHALYQPSPNEIAKFTLSAHYRSLVAKATSFHLFVAREMPELPRSNFFKSLLGSVGTSLIGKQCDRDELFGSPESSTGGSKVAAAASSSRMKQMGGMDRLRGATTGGLASEMRMAREGLDERGEKLSEIEDRTLQMMNQSENYSQTSHQLAQKFKDKKWYHF